MIIIAAYLIGVLTGAIALFTTTIYIGKKAMAKEQFSVKPSRANIDDRLKKVREITDQQLALMQAADGPQKNSLDGKYKNSLNKTVKDLEEDKVEILKSILTDGFDPLITTQDPDGTILQMKLSKFMADTGITMSPTTPQSKPKSSQIGKFTIHKGGKDDGGTTSH